MKNGHQYWPCSSRIEEGRILVSEYASFPIRREDEFFFAIRYLSVSQTPACKN